MHRGSPRRRPGPRGQGGETPYFAGMIRITPMGTYTYGGPDVSGRLTACPDTAHSWLTASREGTDQHDAPEVGGREPARGRGLRRRVRGGQYHGQGGPRARPGDAAACDGQLTPREQPRAHRAHQAPSPFGGRAACPRPGRGDSAVSPRARTMAPLLPRGTEIA